MAQRIEMLELHSGAAQFRQFFEQIAGMFVNRVHQLQLVKYALLTREHILFFGLPGTSKTALCNAVFNGITGARRFSVQFSKFMSDDALYGAYDIKLMRENGVLQHNVAGMLPEADFANLDELLDANEPLLRSTLSALNERTLIRGTQQLDMPLMTAYCSTNQDPADYIRAYPGAFAVLDRIMFLDNVPYLSKAEDIAEMIGRFQDGRTTKSGANIDIELVRRLSELVTQPPSLIADQSVIATLGAAIDEYRKARAKLPDEEKAQFILPFISDRRVAKSSQMLEAEAVLNGRLNVLITDLWVAGLVLCTSEPERKLWSDIVRKHVEAHQKRSASVLKNAQGVALKAIDEKLVKEVLNAPQDAKAMDLSRTLQVLAGQFKDIVPADDEIGTYRKEMDARFKQALELVQKRVLAESGALKLPF